MTATDIRVFLIDDDEDDYVITNDLLMDSTHYLFELSWTSDPNVGLAAMIDESHDIYLVDLYLGYQNGMELIQKALEGGCSKPLILLTGTNDKEVDLKALELGASDYLVKGQFNSQMLERSVLYAIRHKQTLNKLRLSESRYRGLIENQTEFISRYNLDTTMTYVNQAYVKYFGMPASELVGASWLQFLPESEQ